MNIYAKDQAKVLFPYWPEEAEWFVVGGTADANEAQTIHTKYPNINYIGFEPQLQMISAQKRLKFPGAVYQYALWDSECTLPIEVQRQSPRGASLCPPDRTPHGETVQCATLDVLSEIHGPFTNVVLWIDIEYAELKALHGAAKMLERGDILLINLEAFDFCADKPEKELTLPGISEYLKRYGLVEIHRWNSASIGGRHDVIFKLEK